MAKYKVLITGKNKAVIDDFFDQMWQTFTMMTTSTRLADMEKHLELFEPDTFVICLNGESREEVSSICEVKRKLMKSGTRVAVVGSKEDCESFQKWSVYMANMVLTKPITAESIRDEIVRDLTELEQMKAELAAEQAMLDEIHEKERRKHVLVIDDDPMMLKLIKEHLHEGYDVATAVSGKIAYKFLENKTTDLILLDYEMPVENGPMVLQELRKKPELDSVPIVFLTGITDKEKIQQALMLKPQGYLLKPIEKDKLMETIEKFIG